MGNFRTIILMTLGAILLIASIVFLVISPVKTKTRIVSSNSLDPNLDKLLKMFGGDVDALIPGRVINRRIKMIGLPKLFKASNNPWKITMTEFVLMQFILCFFATLLGLGLLAFFTFMKMNAIGVILAVLMPFLGWQYPVQEYKSKAKSREMKFKAQLPEAIDYLVMALSGGGYSLQSAFAEVLNYLQPSIIKDEFTLIVTDLDSGHSMESAINRFADRAPTDGIRSFAKALNNANKLSVNLVEILQTRAAESRKDLENEIDRRIATLESKVVMVFSLPTAISLGIIAISPAIWTLSQAL